MAQITTTGDKRIDRATAEIAVALRDATRIMRPEQEYYDEAMRLRDEIMAGTRDLDREPEDDDAEREAEMAWEAEEERQQRLHDEMIGDMMSDAASY